MLVNSFYVPYRLIFFLHDINAKGGHKGLITSNDNVMRSIVLRYVLEIHIHKIVLLSFVDSVNYLKP